MNSSGSSSGDGGLIVSTDGTKGTAFGYDDSGKEMVINEKDDTMISNTSIYQDNLWYQLVNSSCEIHTWIIQVISEQVIVIESV